MPRGKKQCPSCGDLVATRASCCSCGHIFTKKKHTKPKTAKPKINLGRRFESLAYFKHSKVKEKLDRRFREFNYVTDKSRYPEYNLGEKSGEDRFVKRKKKTVKDFLEEE